MNTAGHVAIGALSKHTGTNIETIRYYERIGLLPAPARSSGGYRLYGTSHLKRLNFIRRARMLGFSLGRSARSCGSRTNESSPALRFVSLPRHT
jgi:MerR family mercuric resistance operon transcriptional regulator